MRIEAVLFDLDGTLVDTAPDLVAVLNALLLERNRPRVPYAVARNEVSNGALGLIRLGFGADRAEAELQALRERFLQLYTARVADASTLFSGLDITLKYMNDNNLPWGVVTNKPHAMTEPLLDRLGLLERAACVVSGDRLRQRKPDPAPLRLAAREIDVAPERCVYVGDARRDIEAGRAAGMATVAAAYGYIRPADDPGTWNADALIRRPRDVEIVVGDWLLQPPLRDDNARRAG